MLIRRHPRTDRERTRQSGQSLVEFALVVPIFLLIVFAIIQFGMIMGAQDGLSNAVREATRYASTVPVSNTADEGSCAGAGTPINATFSRLTTMLQQKMPGYVSANLVPCGTNPTDSKVTYCVRLNPDNTYSIWVQVTAVYRHQLFIPVISAIVDRLDGTSDNRLRATATEQMRVETFTLSSPTPGGFPTCAS
jgi:Flp pilus assembly protein TadG